MKNTTSLTYFSSVLKHLERHGFPIKDTINAIEFNEFYYLEGHHRIALSYYSDALEYGKTVTQNSLFGCQLGADIHNADYGVLGFLIESSANVGSAINNLLKFDRIVANIGQCALRHNLQTVTLSWHPHSTCSEQVVLRNMSAWITTAIQLVGYSLAPMRIGFVHQFNQAEITQLSQFFHCPIVCGEDTNYIDFPFEFLNLEFRNDSHQIHQAMLALSQEQLSQLNTNDSAKNRVEDLLRTKIDLNHCSLINFASALHVSSRTLQRQLKAENHQFGELLDQERQRRTLILIGEIPLTQLAHQLGFNEQSSLNRVFKRWFNCTPKQYLAKQENY